MTLRAFIIGLAAVAGLSLLDPYTSFINGYGWLIIGSFPTGAVVVLVALTLGVNLLLKLLRRGWELSRPELMLIWCMLIVAAVVPTEGLGRWLFHMTAGGPYLARRPDVQWEEDGSLSRAPAGLVLSRNPRSEAARRYYEGSPERARVPWGRWLKPLLHWAVFLLLLFLAVFCMSGMMRRQWVESERLMFPLARVPLEFTQGSGGGRLLPELCYRRGFVLGVCATAGFRLLRALPLFFGAEGGIPLSFPFADVLRGTALEPMAFDNVNLHLTHVGFAYLVSADVSLSVWFFFLFSRTELLVGHWLAWPEAGGGTWSPMMRWQQFGAYIAFTVGMLYMARRHLARVVKRAIGRGEADDSDEPLGYRGAFWGFLLAVGGCIGWYAWHGMDPLLGLLVLTLILCSYLVYARIVAQGGLPVTRNLWTLVNPIEATLGSGAFGAQGALVTSMQSQLLVTNSTTVIGPMAMMAMRISGVFKRRRRLLVPALMAGIVLAMACTTWVVLREAYSQGALNFSGSWAPKNVPTAAFGEAQRLMEGRSTAAHGLYARPLVFGVSCMAFLMFMRARFYWWPIHSIGLLTASSWNMMRRLWLAFLIGWVIKVAVMKFLGGRALRTGRHFFIGLIVTESFLTGLSTLIRVVSGGASPSF